MHGKIIKGIAGFYYIHSEKSGIYECRAKGIFRKDSIKPLIGDNVVFDVTDQQYKKGNVIEILTRNNELIRPAVANVDQALIIFAAAKPNPNFNLLDRFLLMMEQADISTVICFNKKDIVTEAELSLLKNIYKRCGYKLLFISAKENQGLENLKDVLRGKTTVAAGPSGVGKSSVINLLQPGAGMEIGEISKKIERGKHTTRHSELIHVEGNTYIVDTPGFSSLFIQDFQKEELKNYFVEFKKYQPQCRFQGCNHIHEPGCSVKKALEDGDISHIRYENYIELFQELEKQRRY